MGTFYLDPEGIQKRSFEIISHELENRNASKAYGRMTDAQKSVVIRCIHTTADFDYAENLKFSDGAIAKFHELVESGAYIVTDTNMALAGINRANAERYGCKLRCFMADEDVAAAAKKRGRTRASVSVEKAAGLDGPVIFVIGNAPTALITLKEHYDIGYRPAFVIGVPVGFVNVVEAKELIMGCDIPYIVNAGQKGGSNVAAAIVNALLLLMPQKDMRGV